VRLGMEVRFFVEAKSFIFSVAKGSIELGVVEKRKGFSGVVLLGSRCVAWLLSMMVEGDHCSKGWEEFRPVFGGGSLRYGWLERDDFVY
jgi:hypothetical protein